MSESEYDRKSLAAPKQSLGISHTNTSFDPLTQPPDSDLSDRAQALQDAAYACKHKLAPHNIGLEDPEWIKRRDDNIQKEQKKKEQEKK